MKEIIKYEVKSSTETEIVEIYDWKVWDSMLSEKYSNHFYFIDNKLKSYITDTSTNMNKAMFLQGGDNIKTMDYVGKVCNLLNDKGVDKNSLIISIGGGSISDLIGFVSSIYLRGVDYTNIPSTLLSLVDAGIGGKNGVNFQSAKNQIGTIYQPKYIGIDFNLISNTPIEIISEGMAEIIKYALTLDKKLYKLLLQNDVASFIKDSRLQKEIIIKSIMRKVSIIEKDPFDKSERKILNYGHTFGHAIEAVHHLSHGEAVALGMMLATKFSNENYSFTLPKLKNLLKQYELPTKYHIDTNKVIEKLSQDKKKNGKMIDYPFMTGIGKGEIKTIKLVELEKFLTSNQSSLWN